MAEIKIVLRYLPSSVDNERLASMCEEYGVTTSANVITDRETGESRGFGFVEFENADSLTKAIEGLDGREVDGKNISVSAAKPRGDRSERPQGACYAFQRGECTRGDSCRFSHDPSAGGSSYGGGSDYNRDRPRGPCYAFQRGDCTRGDSCRFSHDSSAGGASYGGGSDYNRDRPRGACYAFQKGECTRGDSCRFSHDSSAGGSSYGGGSDYNRDRPRGACYAFQKGDCTRGDSCRFSHDSGSKSDDYKRSRDSDDRAPEESDNKKIRNEEE